MYSPIPGLLVEDYHWFTPTIVVPPVEESPTSATYAAEHAKMYRTPVYQVELSSPLRPTSSLLFSTVFWDVWQSGGGNPILVPLDLFSQVELDQARAPLSTFRFQLIDPKGSYTATHSIADGIIGYIIRLNAGFWDIQWAGDVSDPVNNVRLFTGIVTEAPNFHNGVYTILARGMMAAAQQVQVFAGAQTRLTSSINSSLTTIPVADTSGFDSASVSDPKFALIDDEILTYQGKTTATLENVSRGGETIDVFGTLTNFPYAVPPRIKDGQAAAHSLNATVSELVSLGRLIGIATVGGASNHSNGGTNDIHPMDLFSNVLTSTSLKIGLGEGLPIELNDTEIATARAAIGSSVQFRYLDNKEIPLKEFVERLAMDCAGYPTEDAYGRVGFRLFPTESDFNPVDHITDADILDTPEWADNAEQLINTVVYHYDHIPGTDEYTSTFYYRDAALIAIHGRELPLHIFSKGIRSRFQEFLPGTKSWFDYTAAFLTAASRRHLARFGVSLNVLRIKTILQKNLLRVGDDVQGTFTNVPDRTSGTTQIINRPFHIVGMKLDFTTNTIDMDLMEHTDYIPPFMVDPIFS
jgi:hypothetical protein